MIFWLISPHCVANLGGFVVNRGGLYGEVKGRGLVGGYWRDVVVEERVEDLGCDKGRS